MTLILKNNNKNEYMDEWKEGKQGGREGGEGGMNENAKLLYNLPLTASLTKCSCNLGWFGLMAWALLTDCSISRSLPTEKQMKIKYVF